MTGAWLYTLIPLLAMVLGAAATTVRRPGPRLTSGIQHFAAGVVFAATATEILPDLKGKGAAVPVFIGGMIGLGVMLLIRELGSRASGSMGFYVTMAPDILVDGLVLGIGFAAGPRQGLLLTIALTLEVLFWG